MKKILLIVLLAMSLGCICNAAPTKKHVSKTKPESHTANTVSSLTPEQYIKYKKEALEYADAEIFISTAINRVGFLRDQSDIITERMIRLNREVHTVESLEGKKKALKEIQNLASLFDENNDEVTEVLEKVRAAREKKCVLDKFFSSLPRKIGQAK